MHTLRCRCVLRGRSSFWLAAGSATISLTLAMVSSWVLVPASASTTRPAPLAKHVILIDWDGVEPDFLHRAPMPNLQLLARRGNLSIAEGVFQTVSNPSRASMSTGAYPKVHGNAAYYYDAAAQRAVGQTRFLGAETIAEALASEGRTIASVQWYMVQNHGVAYGDPEHLYVQPEGPCERRIDAAIDILHLRPVDSGGQMVTVPRIPDLLAVYCSDPDALAHQEGAESPNVGVLMAELDRQLGRLIQATRDVDIFGRTAFILTSDHGITSWNRTLIPRVLEAVAGAGYRPQIVTPRRTAREDTEVIIVPNSVRTGQLTLRGAADTPEGRAAVAGALEALPEVARVLDEGDLEGLRASPKVGDLVAEAKPPWGFALFEPPEGMWRASHGSTEEMEVPLLLSGAGFRPHVSPDGARLVDVAPTVAALLGVRGPQDADGRVLSEVLLPSAPPGGSRHGDRNLGR